MCRKPASASPERSPDGEPTGTPWTAAVRLADRCNGLAAAQGVLSIRVIHKRGRSDIRLTIQAWTSESTQPTARRPTFTRPGKRCCASR